MCLKIQNFSVLKGNLLSIPFVMQETQKVSEAAFRNQKQKYFCFWVKIPLNSQKTLNSLTLVQARLCLRFRWDFAFKWVMESVFGFWRFGGLELQVRDGAVITVRSWLQSICSLYVMYVYVSCMPRCRWCPSSSHSSSVRWFAGPVFCRWGN